MASNGAVNVKSNANVSRESKTQSGELVPSNTSKSKDYSSQGVTDNDIFLLPASDFQLLGVITVVAALVRLFRIYQPSSVVFDEVQYVVRSRSSKTVR